jgi:hypothetical protein
MSIKYGNLNLPDSQGPAQACSGKTLPLLWKRNCLIDWENEIQKQLRLQALQEVGENRRRIAERCYMFRLHIAATFKELQMWRQTQLAINVVKQDRQCTHNVILRRVYEIIFTVRKQYAFRITRVRVGEGMCVCVCGCRCTGEDFYLEHFSF